MKCINKTKNIIAVQHVEHAKTYLSRLTGLLGRSALRGGHGLLLDPCNAIHMMFMRFSIDAVFIDKDNRVKHIERGLRPWRFSKVVRGAKTTLELPAGAATGNFDINDEITFE